MMDNCNHIVAFCENGERNKSFEFADGEQVDLVRESDYEAVRFKIMSAGHFLSVFGFCPLCGQKISHIHYDVIPKPRAYTNPKEYSAKELSVFHKHRQKHFSK